MRRTAPLKPPLPAPRPPPNCPPGSHLVRPAVSDRCCACSAPAEGLPRGPACAGSRLWADTGTLSPFSTHRPGHCRREGPMAHRVPAVGIRRHPGDQERQLQRLHPPRELRPLDSGKQHGFSPPFYTSLENTPLTFQGWLLGLRPGGPCGGTAASAGSEPAPGTGQQGSTGHHRPPQPSCSRGQGLR